MNCPKCKTPFLPDSIKCKCGWKKKLNRSSAPYHGPYSSQVLPNKPVNIKLGDAALAKIRKTLGVKSPSEIEAQQEREAIQAESSGGSI